MIELWVDDFLPINYINRANRIEMRLVFTYSNQA